MGDTSVHDADGQDIVLVSDEMVLEEARSGVPYAE